MKHIHENRNWCIASSKRTDAIHKEWVKSLGLCLIGKKNSVTTKTNLSTQLEPGYRPGETLWPNSRNNTGRMTNTSTTPQSRLGLKSIIQKCLSSSLLIIRILPLYSSLECDRITKIPQFIQAQKGWDRRPELNS